MTKQEKVVVAPNIDDVPEDDIRIPKGSKIRICKKCKGRVLVSAPSIKKIDKGGYEPLCGDCAVDIIEAATTKGEEQPIFENKKELEGFLQYQLERTKRKALVELAQEALKGDGSSSLPADKVLEMTQETVKNLIYAFENGTKTLEQILYAGVLIGTASASLSGEAWMALKNLVEEKMYPGKPREGTNQPH